MTDPLFGGILANAITLSVFAVLFVFAAAYLFASSATVIRHVFAVIRFRR